MIDLRSLARRLLPERLRMRLHPFPSLRESVLYPGPWEPPPKDRVLVLSHRPGSALVACGGSLARWADAGAEIQLWCLTAKGGALPAPVAAAAEQLGIKQLRCLDQNAMIREAEGFDPQVLLGPAPFGGPYPRTFWLLLERVARVCRPQWVALHEGAGPGVVNTTLRLDDEEIARKRQALERISAEMAAAAEGLSEYRGFNAAFIRGHAEAFLRVSGPEFLRLIPFFRESLPAK